MCNFCITNMGQKPYIKQFRVSEVQRKSLDTLERYGVNVSHFIRCAIKEKIQRDWSEIKREADKRNNCPF